MKWWFNLILCSLLIACQSKPSVQPQTDIARTLIIFYDPQQGSDDLLAATKRYGAELIYHYHTLNGIAIRLPAEQAIPQTIRHFEQVKGVLSVSQDQVVQLH